MLDVDAAVDEITTKTRAQIEAETAWKWASRAIACARIGTNVGMEIQAHHYADEAREHAALVRDGGRTLLMIEAALAGG